MVETALLQETAGPGHEDVVAIRETLLMGLRALPPRQRAVLVTFRRLVGPVAAEEAQ